MKSGNVGDFVVEYEQEADFHRILSEISEQGHYHFDTTRDDPFIIDGGSHIGVTILSFKTQYPNARIVGFEPDPRNWALLQRNVEQNDLQGVTLVNRALASEEGHVALYVEGGVTPSTWGNSIINDIWGDADETTRVSIDVTTLSQYITEPVDFLKLDIEGCEEQVLRECGPRLSLVRNIELEYHGTDRCRDVNDLGRIRSLLDQAGFSVAIEEKDVRKICREQTIARVNPRFAQVRATRQN